MDSLSSHKKSTYMVSLMMFCKKYLMDFEAGFWEFRISEEGKETIAKTSGFGTGNSRVGSKSKPS